MKPDTFRKLALALPEAEEREHMKHPDFRVRGKVFATLGYPDEAWGMVKLTPEEQSSFMAADPESFRPCAGAWGKKGCTNVQLKTVKKGMLQAALEAAHERLA